MNFFRAVLAIASLFCLQSLLPSISAYNGCSVNSWNGWHGPNPENFGSCKWNIGVPTPTNPTTCQPTPRCAPIPSIPHNCTAGCSSDITLQFNTETITNSWGVVINGWYLSKSCTTNGGWKEIPNCDPADLQTSWQTQTWFSDVLMVDHTQSWLGTNTPFFTQQWRSPTSDEAYWGSFGPFGLLGNNQWAPIWQVKFPFWNCAAVTTNWMLTFVTFPGGVSIIPLNILPAASQVNSFAYTRNCPNVASSAAVQPVPSSPTSAPATHLYSTSLPLPSAKGDPQFAGLRGQDYQVHGIDGGIYNLISDRYMQLNSKFVFLTGPRPCPVMPSTGKKSVACFAHAGSYLGNLALRTSGEDRVLIESGSAEQGLVSVTVNGEALEVGEEVELTFAAGSKGIVSVISSHEVRLVAGLFELEVESSDGFLNIRSVHVRTRNWAELKEEKAHGLLGQTWKLLKGRSAIEGKVDDYLLESGNLFGTDFMFNRFGIVSQ